MNNHTVSVFGWPLRRLEAFVLLLCLLIALIATSGCASLGNQTAAGEQSVGDVYANSKLAKVDPTPAGTAAQKQAVADLTRVGNDLKSFAAGTLSNFELGAVQAQLKADGVALSNDTAALTQINSVANIFSKSIAGPNGTVTPAQSLAQGTVANIVSGFTVSIETYEGEWSISNPGAWSAPSSMSDLVFRNTSVTALYTRPAADPNGALPYEVFTR